MEPYIVKCDFCEITLKTDRETSLHLISDIHRENVHKFNQNQPNDPRAKRSKFKSIADVYIALRLRTVGDVRELADKDYFRIPEDDAQLLNVVQRLPLVFQSLIAEHKFRGLPNGQDLLRAFVGEQEEEEEEEDDDDDQVDLDQMDVPEQSTREQAADRLWNPNSAQFLPTTLQPTHSVREQSASQRARAETQRDINQPQRGPPASAPNQFRPPAPSQAATGQLSGIAAQFLPMAPAMASMPRPQVDMEQPRPRLDSTYRPQLERIKIEPKDD